MTTLQVIITLAVIAVVTLATRGIAFVIFPGNKPVPPFISYLSKVLPFAVIGMLVIYCIKDITLLSRPHGLPELLGCLATALLHLWKHNNLISIGGGTVIYMLLVQQVFK
ncbi:MAG: branched-chain amino acid transporter permease [Oscillospiraceae bacterium]|nr:branched-chain amino acid transporter permease [Oscillospiraceae bacterium]